VRITWVITYNYIYRLERTLFQVQKCDVFNLPFHFLINTLWFPLFWSGTQGIVLVWNSQMAPSLFQIRVLCSTTIQAMKIYSSGEPEIKELIDGSLFSFAQISPLPWSFFASG